MRAPLRLAAIVTLAASPAPAQRPGTIELGHSSLSTHGLSHDHRAASITPRVPMNLNELFALLPNVVL